MSIRKRAGAAVGTRVGQIAPGPTSAVVHQALSRAVRGPGPLPGAAAAANKQLAEQPRGNGAADEARRVDRAVDDLIANHVRLAGVEGFVTNLGGVATMVYTVPTNLAGLALLQCRLVAGIAHLRGYDVDDPRVRNAVLACILGERTVARLVTKGVLPGTPSAIATGAHAPLTTGELDRVVAAQVTAALVARVGGRRIATMVGKRIPVVGGLVGAGTDALATRAVGRYAATELPPRVAPVPR